MDTLKIGWCKIGDGDGAKALADLLMFNQTLSTVDLRGNTLVRTLAVCASCSLLSASSATPGRCTSRPGLQ